jgi:membrane associated rhomboid family serine protease
MIPLYDTAERQKIPYVNFLLIASNSIIFIIQILQPNFDDFVHKWGLIPVLFDETNQESYKFIFSSFFLHSSIFHLLISIWFLKIAGDILENRFGHLFYLLFYFVAGIAGIFVQIIFIKWLNIPLIGATGAISGVIGAYLIMQYRSKLTVWFPFKDIKKTKLFPPWSLLIYWVLLQILAGFWIFREINYNLDGNAWWANAGGFLFGVGVGFIVNSFSKAPTGANSSAK